MQSKNAIAFAGVVVSVFLVVTIFAISAEDATYVGASKCKKCHIKQFKSWEKTAHAGNFEILTMMGKDEDPECVKCHSTGYGIPGGFVDKATTPHLAGTGCESCHGPGSVHIRVDTNDPEQAKATIAKPTGPCVTCHNPHISRQEEAGADALPVLRKKLEELQKRIEALEAQ